MKCIKWSIFYAVVFLGIQIPEAVAQKITITKKNAGLYDVINEIRNQSGFDFLLNGDLLKNASAINIKVKEVSVKQALDAAFINQPFVYEIKNNNTVIIKPRSGQLTVQITNTIKTIDQKEEQNLINGKVVDSLGWPIPGVTVAVKNESQTAMTNLEGEFTILASTKAKNTKLVLSHLGLKTLDHTVSENNRKNLVLVMFPLSIDMDDVVITGYSNIRKESFTGNAIKVEKQDLLKVGNRNVIDILQVFDPSFRVEVNNLRGSDPNSLPEFYVRGRSGIGVKELENGSLDLSQAALTNNPNLPIFIMDNYEVTAQRVYDFDINQIKSVTILKDAAATAVYGSRAANGVVIIETIPPTPGKLRFNYTAAATLTMPDLSDYNLMNATEKLEAERLAGIYTINSVTNPTTALLLTDEYLRKKAQINRGVNSDWISQPLANEFNQKHSLNIDGGTEQIRFNLALHADRQNGVMKQSARNRNGVGLSVEYRLKNLQVRNDINYDNVGIRNSPYGSFSDYTYKNPYDEIYNAAGIVTRTTFPWHATNDIVNPLYEAFSTQNYNIGDNTTLSNNLAINWIIIPKLQFKGTLSLTKTDDNTERYFDPASGRYTISSTTDYSTVGQLDLRKMKVIRLNTNAFVNYVNTINNHNVNISAGVNAIENRGESGFSSYTGFADGSQHTPNLANKIVTKPTYVQETSRLFGSFLTLNYSFKDIYLLDLSGRLDGSSEFGSKSKFAPFWSIGTGINFHKYQFIKDLDYISRARITANTGQLGKTNFPPYASKDNYSILTNWYSTGPGVSLYYMGNPYLSWEKTNTYDLIFDLGFFNDRLTVNYNFYQKDTKDLVTDITLPLSSGFAQYKGNIGQVQNKGHEIRFRYDLIRQSDFNLALYGNFARNTNILKDISNALKEYNDLVDKEYDNYNNGTQNKTKFSTPHIKYVEGGSLTSLFGMQSLGINPMDGKEIFMRKDGTITTDWDAKDQVIIGDLSPKGQGSFGINAFYKNFSLFASFLYEFGRDEYNTTLLNKVENVDIYNRNADRRFLEDRWKQPGDIAKYKNIADLSWTTRPTSRFMQRANSITFNSLSLGYSFDKKTLQKLGKFHMLRIQANTNNLFKISTVKQERGLEYPYARTFDLSLNLGF